jgi:hypothetical protein
MTTRRRGHRPPLTDPQAVADAFATGFEIDDGEDWLRLTGWTERSGNGGDGGGLAERRKTVSLVLPRSAVYGLMEALSLSMANGGQPRRHS